jgi:hypothetical protein
MDGGQVLRLPAIGGHIMDFKGTTTAEAANQLLSFVDKVAHEIGISLDVERGGIPALHNDFTVRARSASGATFYLETAVEDEVFVAVQRRQNPTQVEFGSGSITKRGGNISLRLRREPDGAYRWYGIPVELTANVKKIIPSPGPFPLTKEFVSDGLHALTEKDQPG